MVFGGSSTIIQKSKNRPPRSVFRGVSDGCCPRVTAATEQCSTVELRTPYLATSHYTGVPKNDNSDKARQDWIIHCFSHLCQCDAQLKLYEFLFYNAHIPVFSVVALKNDKRFYQSSTSDDLPQPNKRPCILNNIFYNKNIFLTLTAATVFLGHKIFYDTIRMAHFYRSAYLFWRTHGNNKIRVRLFFEMVL